MKILIADDHPLLLSGIVSYFEGKACKAIYRATNGSDAWRLINDHQPDLAILDIEMPGLTGLEIAEKCKNDKLGTKIIILSQHQEPELVARSKQLGIFGYVLKEDALEEIDACIQAVQDGERYYSSFFETAGFQKQLKENAKLDALSRSEIKILKLIASSMSSKEIADTIFISERTVEKHRSNIIQKLGLEGKNNRLSEWAIAQKSRIDNH